MKELKDFTGPKYADGAAALRGLVGASRYVPDGTMIASWGDGSIYARHAQTVAGFYLVKENDKLFALVVSPIQEEGTYAGYDVCIFEANVLVENKSEIVTAYTIEDAGAIDVHGDKHEYSIPLYQGRLLLTATPDAGIFKDATLQAFYFVSLYSCALFIFISIFSYFTFYRFVKKIIDDHVTLIARADGLLAEKELILKEVHHRIKNNMNTISSLLSLQSAMIAEPAAISALSDAGNRIRSMSLLYDKLYRSVDYSELSVKDYLTTLVDEVVVNFPNSQHVRVEKRLEDFMLDAKRMQPLGIIINELITNAMKYAFRGREHGVLTVSAAMTGALIQISIQDDGTGIPDSITLEGHDGFGLQLVNALARQLDGTIRIERDNGTRIVLEFSK